MELSKLILNPARLRILQYIQVKGTCKTSDIAENLSDIPRATVYHHVKLLEENNLIEVVEENRVRGTVEKVYAMRSNDVLEQGESPLALSTAFHLGLMQEMNAYFDSPNQDYKKDTVFFTTAMLQVTEEEYQALITQMMELMRPLLERSANGNLPMRKLSLISSPPEKSRK